MVTLWCASGNVDRVTKLRNNADLGISCIFRVLSRFLIFALPGEGFTPFRASQCGLDFRNCVALQSHLD